MELDADGALDREVVLDHSRRPRHHGLRAPFDVEVRHLNPVCGDRVVLRVALDGERVRDVSYEALGCAISQASTSMMAELVVGQGPRDAPAGHRSAPRRPTGSSSGTRSR